MNYGELKSNVALYARRTDLEDLIPLFVVLAQARMNKELKSNLLNTSAVLGVSAGAPLVTHPEGLLETKSIRIISSTQNVAVNPDGSLMLNPDGSQAYNPGASTTTSQYSGGHQPLTQQSLYQNSVIFKQQNGVTDIPRFYANTGTHYELCPSPSDSMYLYVVYRKMLMAFTTDTGVGGTDVILTKFPDIYLYAVLKELAIHIRDNDRIQLFEHMFKNAVAGANDLSENSEFSGAPLQTTVAPNLP